MNLEMPYLTMAEAGELLRYRGPNAHDSARQFLKEHGAPFYRRGRSLLVHVDDVHEVLSTGACVMGQRRRQQELAAQSTRTGLRRVR